MKKIYFSLLLALLFALPALANNVIVKGQVKFSNGAPAVNIPVWISTDSASTPSACMQTSVAYTNANGYYIDTLSCTGNIVKIRIKVQNCDGAYLAENPQVTTATNLVERNFVLCTGTQSCEAKFGFNITNLVVSFQSHSTTAPGSAITSHVWSFGDGSGATSANPVHSYAAAGTYTVKLIIHSGNGCKDTAVKTITVFNTSGTCHAQFKDSMLTGNKFIFLSGSSTSAAGDTIRERVWHFGDGSVLGGNHVNPDHIYQVSGSYNVCLKIFTAKGCIDSVCKTINVVAPGTGCTPKFSFQRTSTTAPFSVQFNSADSKGVSATDSIVARFWTFGDGQQLAGNVISPLHSYTAKGSYQVCLKITTAAGCQKTECKTVVISDSTCHAAFSYELAPGGMVKFTNKSSTLSQPAQYYWSFGDGTFSATKDAAHNYAPGTYTACLRLYTTTGCVDSVCKTIVVPPAVCKAVFSYTGLPGTPGTAGFSIKVDGSGSHTGAAADSIREWIWKWGDGTATTGTHTIMPTHQYAAAGTYTVCLIIRTKSGCSDTFCKTIILPLPNQVACVARFEYEHLPATSVAGKSIRFNSAMSATVNGDSIISRKWEFGNGAVLGGNVVNPVYVYTSPGNYYVCLTIKTARGCEKKECKLVIVPQSAGACVPHFSWQLTAPRQVSFNSATSWVTPNDSIVERKWNFGDATPVLSGNQVAPVHAYAHPGIYTVSLKIRTKLHCEKNLLPARSDQG